jgi:hypothetical protein
MMNQMKPAKSQPANPMKAKVAPQQGGVELKFRRNYGAKSSPLYYTGPLTSADLAQMGGTEKKFRRDAFGKKSPMMLSGIPITSADLSQLGGVEPAWQNEKTWGDGTPKHTNQNGGTAEQLNLDFAGPKSAMYLGSYPITEQEGSTGSRRLSVPPTWQSSVWGDQNPVAAMQ